MQRLGGDSDSVCKLCVLCVPCAVCVVCARVLYCCVCVCCVAVCCLCTCVVLPCVVCCCVYVCVVSAVSCLCMCVVHRVAVCVLLLCMRVCCVWVRLHVLYVVFVLCAACYVSTCVVCTVCCACYVWVVCVCGVVCACVLGVCCVCVLCGGGLGLLQPREAGGSGNERNSSDLIGSLSPAPILTLPFAQKPSMAPGCHQVTGRQSSLHSSASKASEKLLLPRQLCACSHRPSRAVKPAVLASPCRLPPFLTPVSLCSTSRTLIPWGLAPLALPRLPTL